MSASRVFRPSQRYETKLQLWVWLIFVPFVLPFVFLGFIPGAGWLYVVVFLVANALWLVPTLLLIPLYCRSVEYELGEEEIIVRRGIITRTVSMVPYRAVTNLAVLRGPLDRWLAMGGLAVHTAGFSGQSATAEAQLSGLTEYDRVHQDILARLRRHRAQSGPPLAVEQRTDASAGLPSEAVAPLLQQILKELQALRRELSRD